MKAGKLISNIPSWGNYRIESYWHSGVTYPPTEEAKEMHVQMVLADGDQIIIYVS